MIKEKVKMFNNVSGFVGWMKENINWNYWKHGVSLYNALYFGYNMDKQDEKKCIKNVTKMWPLFVHIVPKFGLKQHNIFASIWNMVLFFRFHYLSFLGIGNKTRLHGNKLHAVPLI